MDIWATESLSYVKEMRRLSGHTALASSKPYPKLTTGLCIWTLVFGSPNSRVLGGQLSLVVLR